MREDDVVLKVFVLLRIGFVGAILPSEVFDVKRYYSERLLIQKEVNSTSFFVAAQSKERAFAQLAPLVLNCSFPEEVTERTCDSIDDDFCGHDEHDAMWKRYGIKRDFCDCYLDSCGDSDLLNVTETILYPGCTCSKDYTSEPCDWENVPHTCPQWRDVADGDLVFNIIEPEPQQHRYKNFVQAGSNKTFERKTVSMVSSVFRQSGINCALLFHHHFTPQSASSNLAVRAHLLNGETHTLFEYGSASSIMNPWLPARVLIGSYSQPFWISIDCETGMRPRKKNRKQKDFTCGLAAIQFESCVDIRNPLENCPRGDQFLCSTPSHTKCLHDVQCDLKVDCEDESDEMDCGPMVPGSVCDFNTADFCEGWVRKTRISGVQESRFEPTTVAPVNKQNETYIYLLKIRTPNARLGVKRPARQGSGPMLYYQSDTSLSKRTSVLESPVFPRTNPEAYDPKNRLFQTCKVRFYACAATYYTTWHISIISRTGDPFDSGRTALYESKAFDIHQEPRSTCVWQRHLVNVPRQNGGFRLGIFVEHNFDRDDFLAMDDLSFSPSCFERDVNQSSWETPNVLISSCGTSGSEKPQNCRKYRELDGQTGHFLKEDGTQEWTVPLNGFYRIEACGAAGGSNQLASGERAECVTLQVHLMENVALRMLIGQMGESPCLTEQEDEFRSGSCASSIGMRREEREGGAGGGGATLIKVEESTWNVVVGGGAGASWSTKEDSKSGYGASVVEVDIDGHCTQVCRTISHENFFVEKTENKCPDHQKDNQTTVFGGFGGGGNSCGMLGGGGAGYRAGNPFAVGRNRSGSSNVTMNFSKQVVYFQSATNGDGFIRISFCRKECPPPSVCRFNKEKAFEEEYCGCPDGSDYKNSSESCACPLDCPAASTCQYRNFTFEPFCMCNNGKLIDDFSEEACEEFRGWLWYNYLLFVFILGMLSVAGGVVFYYRRESKQMTERFAMEMAEKENTYYYNEIYFGSMKRNDALAHLPKINRSLLMRGRVLGKGNFGEVYYGTYQDEQIAVKSISQPFAASTSAQMDFCNEALCMGTFVHENVVKLIGVDFDVLPYIIALEFMEGGDLLSFVKDGRPNKISLNPFNLTMSDLIGLVRDVAAGCRRLELDKYVHRDIAARNILLTTRGVNRVAKIADFGMAKELNLNKEYYRVHGRAMLPIKWTPPEAFIDGKFTTKSDVWSFGILCWEVFSLGVVPYPNRRNEEVMLMLTEGGRLEYPYGIPTRVYQLMRECWRTDAELRLTFFDVVDILEDILQDPAAIGMPFPIHPTVRASYAHTQSTPVSVETPMTAMTDVSVGSAFSDATTVKVSSQQEVQDRINLHEMMLTREPAYSSEMATCIVDNLRKDLARAQFETGTTTVPQPQYLSPESIDESMQLIPNGSAITDETPPTSQVDLNRLAVQDTGPTLHRPDCLNINDYYSSVPLLECQTR